MADEAQRVLADPQRLRSLQRVCVGAEPDEAFDRFAGLVKRLLGVPVALVSLVDDKRQFFPGQVGLGEPWSDRRETPLSHSFCQHVVIEGEAKVFPDARIYAQARDNLAIADLGVVAYAGVPLTDTDGRTLGSLCAIDSKPRGWTKDELAVLDDLAAACSSELRLRIARELAEEARRKTEEAHEQLAMLAELTEALVTTLDIEEALRRLASAVTPRLADWCVVSLFDSTGTLRPIAAAHGEPAHTAGAAHLTVPVTAPVTRVVLGTISLVNGPARPAFSDADERTAMDIAHRAGLSIDNSRLYRQQRHVAEVLQQSLLTELPAIPGLELHARYLPAQDGAAVGGDWYDAFAQPDGSVMLAVGDVCGHDIEAAATMGQLRNLIRGDAYGRDDEPGPLLTQLDRAVRGLGVPAAATAVLARARRDGAGFRISFSNAGHPPPLLMHPDGTVEVWWEKPEPLLGLRSCTDRRTHQRHAPAGSTLLLYTDGLIEDRSQPIDVGIVRIEEVLRGNAQLPGEELCSRLIASVGRRADDIALLLIRLT